jgi:arsenate reductase-like glutaredoxin family protein
MIQKRIEKYTDILENNGISQNIIDFLSNAMIDEMLIVLGEYYDLQEAIRQIEDKEEE